MGVRVPPRAPLTTYVSEVGETLTLTYPGYISRRMKIEPTKVNNLIRDGDTGIYYARIKIRQKVYIRSLEETTLSNAKLRLQDKLNEIRNSLPDGPAEIHLDSRAKFEDAVKVYEKEVDENNRLEDSSKEFRLRPIATVRRVWPKIFQSELRGITSESLKTFMREFESGKSRYKPHRAKKKTVPGNSPTVVNALVGFFRRVFDIGIRAGIISRNPASNLKRMRPRKKLLELPNEDEFATMILHIRQTAGRGRIVGDLVEGLAYSGMRIDESRRLCWRHLDFGRGWITVHGTKSEESARMVPMTNAFRELAEAMKEHRGTVNPDDLVFEAKEATVSLRRACEHIGRKKMTHHDLRHLFATTCIESNVDVPTVAKWLGHSDGGALAMKTYGHVRLHHSVEAAKKVKFKRRSAEGGT